MVCGSPTILMYQYSSKVFLRVYVQSSRVGHRWAQEISPSMPLSKGPCFHTDCISVKHLYWCTWLNLRQGWQVQSSKGPIVSLNTHRHASAAWCCEQIAEYWGLSRPQASLGQFLSETGKVSREWPWQGAVGGRAVQDKVGHRSTSVPGPG